MCMSIIRVLILMNHHFSSSKNPNDERFHAVLIDIQDERESSTISLQATERIQLCFILLMNRLVIPLQSLNLCHGLFC